jgi:hypothetical protein
VATRAERAGAHESSIAAVYGKTCGRVSDVIDIVVIGRGFNQWIGSMNQTAHAESSWFAKRHRR